MRLLTIISILLTIIIVFTAITHGNIYIDDDTTVSDDGIIFFHGLYDNYIMHSRSRYDHNLYKGWVYNIYEEL